LLLIGFAGAFRRSELVALNVDDIEEVTEGLRINIRHSKTDQDSRGEVVAIPRGRIACPVGALMTWIAAANLNAGAVFRPIGKSGRLINSRRTDRSVAMIIKVHAPGSAWCRRSSHHIPCAPDSSHRPPRAVPRFSKLAD
jgi:hypothetical protein